MRGLRLISLLIAAGALFLLAACGAEEGKSGSGNSKNSKTEKSAQTTEKGGATEPAGGQTSGEKTANKPGGATNSASSSSGKKSGSGSKPEVVIDIGGDSGTRFTATCTVGQEERKVKGEVPDKITAGPVGRKVDCEILKRSQGALEVTLIAGDDRHEQRTDARFSRMTLSYSDAGFFSSVKTSSASSSSSSSSSTSQTGGNSTSSSSSSVTSE